jgi:hypothetical protein
MPFFVDKASSSFVELSDTPGAIVANQAVRGNSTGSALEFYVPSGGGSSIDDLSVSSTTTFSSSKIVTELATKANTSALNSYLPLAGGSLSGDVTTNVPNGSFTSTSLVTRNYVDTAVAGASAATTYTALTDTPSSHSANALLYSTGSAIAHTTTQIAIDGNGVEVNQLNARVDGTSNIGDTTHKFNNVFCGNIHQGNVKLVIPSTRGSTGQYVKVANANAEEHTLEFADVLNDAAASSSTTYSSTKINTDLGGKVDKTSIQTLAEGDSSSESDVYSCNSVYSKNQINTSVTSQEVTVNNTSSLGRLNFGSNLTSGLYGTLQTYANGTRYSAMHHYATSGNCNIDWYLMKNNGETKMITIRPNDSEKVFEVLNGGIKAPIFQQRDSTTVIKIGQLDSASYGVPGIAIMPLLNTVNSEIQMRGRRNTGILGDSYVYHQDGSTLTIQSRIQTNRHSTTHANIEVRTYQNGAETKVLDIGASSSSAKTVTVSGTLHATGHVTTDQNNFTANDQLVTKAFVDTSIANLVNSAPSTLDTLNELAAALDNDPNFATTVTNSIATKLPLAGGAMTGQITTNQTVFSNNNELITKQYADTQDATKLSLTGGAMTGQITTNQTVFSNTNELVSKNYVDSRLPTDVNTPISYTIQNAVADQNYVFGISGAENEMALVEIPKVYTGVPNSSRSVRVGFNGGDYGSGAIAVGYEALADSTGSAGQTNAIRSVAVGYQAGYHSQAANHGIYIGPYQGYQLSTSNQLRIGNSGVSPTTTGYDKAIIEGTMATTDAGQTLRLNADTIYLGSSLPTSQPADNRLWLSNGNLSIGAVSGGGGGGGGGPSWTNVNVSSLSFAQNVGVGRGDRRGTWMIEDSNFFFVENLTRMTNQLMNGYGYAQYQTVNDNNYHVRNFGFWVAYPVANVAYNFTKMYINAYDPTQTPTNFIVEGSNDKHIWTILHTCTGTHTVTGTPYNYTSGAQHATYEYALSTGSNYYHYWRLRMTNTGYAGNGDSTTQTYQYWSLREVMFS